MVRSRFAISAAIIALALLTACPNHKPQSERSAESSPEATAIPTEIRTSPPSPTASPKPTGAAQKPSGPVVCKHSGDANDTIGGGSIDPGGRFLVYESHASNLVVGDRNRAVDVFVRDMRTSCIERVSVSTTGKEANGLSNYHSISDDGRFVAFTSDASNLVKRDSNKVRDVFVRDRINHRTERISVSTSEGQANDESFAPTISADGRFVAFLSRANNLAPDDRVRCPWSASTKSCLDAFVRDRLTGKTELVSVSSSGEQANDETIEYGLASLDISNDGRFVAFSSEASNLVSGDSNETSDVFVRDRAKRLTIRISVSSSESQADGASRAPSISPDGGLVAFSSDADGLADGDAKECGTGPSSCDDVYVRDLAAGTTELVSVAVPSSGYRGHSRSPLLSADGRYVTYGSDSTGIAGDDDDDCSVVGSGPCVDTYRYDRVTHRTILVSVKEGDLDRSLGLSPVGISAHGRHILMSMEECGCLFLRDLKQGTTRYLSDVTRPVN